MQSRIDHPALTVKGAMDALQQLEQATTRAGVPKATHELMKLRAGQINGCSGCVDLHSRALKSMGESDQRIAMVAAWRDSAYYSDAERAALALAEAATRLADRPDPVSNQVWEEAARHYDDEELASLVLSIASINAWNRLNVATGQITGEWIAQYLEQKPADVVA